MIYNIAINYRTNPMGNKTTTDYRYTIIERNTELHLLKKEHDLVNLYNEYLRSIEYSFSRRKIHEPYRILCTVKVISFEVVGKIENRDILDVRIKNYPKKIFYLFQNKEFFQKEEKLLIESKNGKTIYFSLCLQEGNELFKQPQHCFILAVTDTKGPGQNVKVVDLVSLPINC